jgi:hypothetical protein
VKRRVRISCAKAELVVLVVNNAIPPACVGTLTDATADDGFGAVPALLPLVASRWSRTVDPCFDAAFDCDGDLTEGLVVVLKDGD